MEVSNKVHVPKSVAAAIHNHVRRTEPRISIKAYLNSIFSDTEKLSGRIFAGQRQMQNLATEDTLEMSWHLPREIRDQAVRIGYSVGMENFRQISRLALVGTVQELEKES